MTNENWMTFDKVTTIYHEKTTKKTTKTTTTTKQNKKKQKTKQKQQKLCFWCHCKYELAL